MVAIKRPGDPTKDPTVVALRQERQAKVEEGQADTLRTTCRGCGASGELVDGLCPRCPFRYPTAEELALAADDPPLRGYVMEGVRMGLRWAAHMTVAPFQRDGINASNCKDDKQRHHFIYAVMLRTLFEKTAATEGLRLPPEDEEWIKRADYALQREIAAAMGAPP